MRVSRSDGRIVLEFADGESGVLRSLVDQYLEVVSTDAGTDPAHAEVFAQQTERRFPAFHSASWNQV